LVGLNDRVTSGDAREPEHEHGHASDQGFSGMCRYMRRLPRMWRSPVSDAVIAIIAPGRGDRMIDIGAGMGPATVVAAKAGATVIAVEPTPFMRLVLRVRRLGQRARARITICDGAAESLPVADASVDGVWAVNSMHHWTDLGVAIGEIQRVLLPGGRVVLVDEDFDHPSHPLHEQFQRRAAHHHSFDQIEPESVAAQMSSAGFSSSTGKTDTMAGRPVKVVRAVK
jgi:ubiquinone/menaquinone biosynthesis C-methylase UbiE